METGTYAEIYDDGYLRVEHSSYYTACDGQPLYNLTRKEFLILSRLVRNAGRIVSKQEIWSHVWGAETEINHSTLRVHVASLRRKLSPFGLDIVVVVHISYRLARTAGQELQSNSITTNNVTIIEEQSC